MVHYSPLRYPGGKGRLANFFRLVIDMNCLSDGFYVEPYAGGAGIGLSLLFNEHVSSIIINDINPSIYAFWYSVLNHPNELCDLILNVPVTMNEWHIQQNIQSCPNSCSLLELGFSTFFLNRTNRSGIIKGGVIGGQSQSGKWKIDARFNKENLVKRIKQIARYSDRIKLYNLDAAKFITEILPPMPKNTLVYLDPPYYNKGPELYENHYEKEDHSTLASLIKNIHVPWIVSYDYTPEICELYRGYHQVVYSLSYSAARRYKGSEVMIFCKDIEIPNILNPSKVKYK